MKSNLIVLGFIAHIFIAGVMADEWQGREGKCFGCLNPFATDRPTTDPIYYCFSAGNCQYDSLIDCGSNQRTQNLKTCIQGNYVTKDSACDTINSLSNNAAPKTNTITLAPNTYCEITLSGSKVTLQITYGANSAFYYPSTGTLDESTRQISGTTLDATTNQVTEIKVILINFDITNPTDFEVVTADPNIPDPNNNNNNNGDQTVTEWTAAREGKCLSCLNPSNSFTDSIYWCTNTNKCESGSNTVCPGNAISAAKSCVTHASKQENPACEIVRDLRATKTPKVRDITLPSDSYCIIKLTGITQRMKVTYSGSSAVYYPATSNWDATTLQVSKAQLSTASSSRILQASGTTELNVAIVNYDPSSSEIFTIEVDDPSVPDDDHGLSAGQISGIAIGSVFFTIIVIGFAIAWKTGALRRRSAGSEEKRPKGLKYTQAAMTANTTVKTDIETPHVN